MDPVPRRGRASALNPPNRFDRLHVEREAADYDDEERRSIETVFLPDSSRSILAKNDSPDVPFTYSLNPYRGCEHGCVYCMDGSTAVLLPDGSTRPLAELGPGDEIVGTVRSGHYRRFVRTVVLAHWKTRKPAFRITLEDGTTLIASGDHRFLTERGWKYVTGAMNGRHRRPYLTTGNSLMGVGIGPFAVADARLRVVGIEPLGGQADLYDITTGTGDFIANGVISHNCYARPSHEYLGYSAGLDFETRILVKERAPELLAMQFEKRSWVPQVVALSGNTDPYQPVERRLGITRRCLEVFLQYRNPVSIITKNHLVTRDLDILTEMARMRLVHVTLSVTSLDADLIGTMEPRTSRPSRRLDAIQALHEAGIPVGVNVAPVVPGITDEEMPAILEEAAARGASQAAYLVLRLPGAVEPLFLEWLERTHPLRFKKVSERIRSLRGGEMNDSRFGKRMRGEGPWADVFSRLFRMTTRRLGLNVPVEPLETGLFRRPGISGQGELF